MAKQTSDQVSKLGRALSALGKPIRQTAGSVPLPSRPSDLQLLDVADDPAAYYDTDRAFITEMNSLIGRARVCFKDPGLAPTRLRVWGQASVTESRMLVSSLRREIAAGAPLPPQVEKCLDAQLPRSLAIEAKVDQRFLARFDGSISAIVPIGLP